MPSAHLLIVDGDPMLGSQLAALLEVLGHRTVLQGDLTQALHLVEEQHFDAIFCDYWLPPHGGQAFYRQIELLRPEMASRIIFLVGGVVGEETQFFISQSGNPQLSKPFKLAAVKGVLETVAASIA